MINLQDVAKEFGATCTIPEKHCKELNNTLFFQPVTFPPSKEEAVGGGIILAKKEKERIIPSFYLLEHFAKQIPVIEVDEKTAYLFTCGRDIFKKNVILPAPQKKYIVVNEQKEVLGVVKEDRAMLKNVLDRGIFLRQELR